MNRDKASTTFGRVLMVLADAYPRELHAGQVRDILDTQQHKVYTCLSHMRYRNVAECTYRQYPDGKYYKGYRLTEAALVLSQQPLVRNLAYTLPDGYVLSLTQPRVKMLIHLHLFRDSQVFVDDLAQAAEVHPRVVYNLMGRLVDNGLAAWERWGSRTLSYQLKGQARELAAQCAVPDLPLEAFTRSQSGRGSGELAW